MTEGDTTRIHKFHQKGSTYTIQNDKNHIQINLKLLQYINGITGITNSMRHLHSFHIYFINYITSKNYDPYYLVHYVRQIK